MYLLELILFSISISCAKSLFNIDLLETAKNPFVYLEENNYHYENHTIITEDGYRLLLVRIPCNRNEPCSNSTSPPILFVHGFLSNFYDFLVTGPGVAFGYAAVERGYDVFLLNTRGSRWSRTHTTLDPDLDVKKYWNFSWHEVGKYDLTATIDYITNLTGSPNVSYVGHSQGTTAFLVMTSVRPEYNNKITVSIFLAPVAYLGHAKVLSIILLKNVVSFVQALAQILNINEIFPYNPIISRTAQLICSIHSPLLPACRKYFYRFISGPSTQINNSIISAFFTNFPSGASTKNGLHFLHNAHSGEFRLYDYGDDGNVAEYGQSEPPNYNLTAITSPIIMYYGSNDNFVALRDERRLARNLPNVVKNQFIPYIQTNHLDLLLGVRAKELVTIPALEDLSKYNNL